MTAYHGGKSRTGKAIAEKILQISKGLPDIKGYCEPFCGMNGVYRLVKPHIDTDTFLAGDANTSLIKMWKGAHNIREKDILSVTEKEYLRMATDGKSSAKKGFIGHAYGFGGIYFGCYRPKYNKDVTKSLLRNSLRNVKRIQRELKGVRFTEGPYTQFSSLKGFVIYCDPPYRAPHTRYYDEKHQKREFSHDAFWKWVRMMSKKNTVLVSEYSAPKDFVEVSSILTHTSYGNGQKSQKERLFIKKGR